MALALRQSIRRRPPDKTDKSPLASRRAVGYLRLRPAPSRPWPAAGWCGTARVDLHPGHNFGFIFCAFMLRPTGHGRRPCTERTARKPLRCSIRHLWKGRLYGEIIRVRHAVAGRAGPRAGCLRTPDPMRLAAGGPLAVHRLGSGAPDKTDRTRPRARTP